MSPRSIASAVDVDALRTYVQRVYAWMVGGLMATAITAFGVASSETLLMAIFGSPLKWVFLLAPLGMVFFLSARIETMKPSTAATLFIVFSISWDVACVDLLGLHPGKHLPGLHHRFGDVWRCRCVRLHTKRDLTSMGSFLFMGLIGLIVAMVVNWFLGSSALEFAISVIGVLIFTGLTAWDMQKIKSQAVVMYAGEALATKRSILGALSLYLNFLNLFLFLLRLLGDRR